MGLKGQHKKHSLFESVFNTAVGFGINLTAQIVVFPFFGMQLSIQQNLKIAIIFTFISIARGYFIRRLFNRIT